MEPSSPASAGPLTGPLAAARRVVVKVGSSSLTSEQGGISERALGDIVDALAALRLRGAEVVFVSSGAIAAGLAPLGFARRPSDLASQQAAATVGQGLLMHRYAERFARHGLVVGQVLLTSEDLVRRSHHINASRALERLLGLGAVPVINENDAVATQEIRVGDNDRLAALVAHLVKADALLLLSDVDAVLTRHPDDGGVRIPVVARESDLDAVEASRPGTGIGTGGMATKIRAASLAADSGITALVTSARRLSDVVRGEDVGTLFPARGPRQPARRLWLAHLADARGSMRVDDGAARALRTRRGSLLAAGIISVEGDFTAGDAVEILDREGALVARGMSAYDAADVPRMMGRSTADMAAELGEGYDRPVVHADAMAVVA
ncbi:glutamate 5-kinase [Falsarthrobacter nasiphocae]|uniref:Glutamate 5-kinase n=1 Tax=Falsarthrobacter nasiphocae TaxID=189863 RepID=A0AAE3YIT6_9MICC|nr:glutamate 5-kinase [Falsarthrobacter nasiphocae]MDR6892939.1 glutamate 5-kinase [Falsarthrobacter nasiphocae]